jgi:hypothetical protein
MIGDFLGNLVDEIDARIRYSLLGIANNGKLILNPNDGGNGFIGQLPQSAVTYDDVELASDDGSDSLKDNLNHIRYDIQSNTQTEKLVWMGW